jgi:Kef-type K+ transport system membrane component KefB
VPDRSFVIVAVIAFLAPVLREMLPRALVPAIVFELLGGIAVGPHGLGIADTTESVELFAQIGLAALLFLAGREIQVDKLRGSLLERSLAGFALGFLIAAGIAAVMHSAGLVKTPLLLAVTLVSTSLSVIIVPLRDAKETSTPFGQQVIAAAAISEFGAVILLSFFFSGERTGISTELVHLSAFVLVAVIVFLSVSQGSRYARLVRALERLREGSAQIQVRADLALVAVVVALANALGLESILAAFTVGVIRGMTSPGDRDSEQRLDAVALGIFVPFFFVASGIDFDADQLFTDLGDVVRLPLFVLAIMLVHLIPAGLYLRSMSRSMALAAGLLQATSFSFIIVATQIGLQLHIMVPETATSMVGAGVITVIAFPALAFHLLEKDRRARGQPAVT